MKRVFSGFVLIAALCLAGLGARASVVDTEAFDDPLLGERYRDLIEELRCLVCQNQSLADSDAELAQDLRQQVKTMLRQRASNEQIKQFMVDRYGDFVLYRPPMNPVTWLLWGGPFLLLLVALFSLLRFIRSTPAAASEHTDFDSSQRERLTKLLDSKNETTP